MIRKTLTWLAVVAALAGCASTAEQIAAADHATCTEYGYPVGHPEYGVCRLALRQMRLDEESSLAARRAAAYSLYLRSQGY